MKGLNRFQKEALVTAPPPSGDRLFGLLLGIAGEAGEVCDELKKVYFHDHILDTSKVCDELGDLLWYVAATADHFGFSLREVAERNIAKIRERYPDGFDPERSKNRGGK